MTSEPPESSSADADFHRRLRIYRALALIAVALIVIGSCIPQITHRDGDPEVFVTAARALLHGQDIYLVLSPHARYFYYPPFFAALNIPLIPLPVVALIILWCIASVALQGWSTAAFYSGMTGRPFFSLPARERWVVCFLSTLLTARFTLLHLRFGQSNIFVLALAVLGLTWLSKRHEVRSGIAIGLSMLVKLTTLPFGVLFLAKFRRRVLLGLALGVLVAVLLPATIVGLRQDLNYHSEWARTVALTDPPGAGSWSGTGNVSPRAQLDRFFLNADAFIYQGQPYRVTLVSLPRKLVRLISYLTMLAVALIIVCYAVRFRNAPALVSQWGGFALVFSLIPNFSPVAEIPHLVLLLPAYVYVVHVWYFWLTSDRIFHGLVVLSFIFASLTTRSVCGLFVSDVLTAYGAITLGMILLSAAIWRAGECIQREMCLKTR